MTGIQTRGDSVGDSSDDEPLSKQMKCKATPEKTQYLEETTLTLDGAGDGPHKQQSSASPGSDYPENACLKETPTASVSAAVYRELKGGSRWFLRSSDSEDDQPLMTLIKKNPEKEESANLDPKGPQKRKMTTRAAKLKQLSPSRAKASQKRGRKGRAEVKRTTTPRTQDKTTKRRGRPRKADDQAEAPSSDISEDEPLSLLVRKRSQPEIKRAVVILKRMSRRELMDALAQGRPCNQDQGTAVKADSSSEEPLVKQGKNTYRERTNGGGDTPTPNSKQAEELKDDSDDKCLGEKKTDEKSSSSPHREPSSS